MYNVCKTAIARYLYDEGPLSLSLLQIACIQSIFEVSNIPSFL